MVTGVKLAFDNITIEGTGHLLNLEAEEEFNTILSTFLRTHATA